MSLTREQFKKHKKAMKAFRKGKDIQFLNALKVWITLTARPKWYLEYDYREKPEPKFVEFWVNVYPNDGPRWFRNKADADKWFVSIRTACLHIKREYEEGEGL